MRGINPIAGENWQVEDARQTLCYLFILCLYLLTSNALRAPAFTEKQLYRMGNLRACGKEIST